LPCFNSQRPFCQRIPHNDGRDAGCHTISWNRLDDNSRGRDYRLPADRDTWQHSHSGAQPSSVTNPHFPHDAWPSGSDTFDIDHMGAIADEYSWRQIDL
jgi:hypothetical protein